MGDRSAGWRRILHAGYWASIGVTRPVVALSVARMADGVGNSILFVLLPLYVAKLPAQFVRVPVEVLVGILLSAYGLVVALFQPLAGALSDRLGRRKPLILAGLLVTGAATWAFVYASRFADLFVLRSIQGLGVALTVPASFAIMAGITSAGTRGGSMGFFTTLRLAGLTLGPLVGGAIVVRFGFAPAFYAGAGFLALAFVLVQLWVADVRPDGSAEDAQGRFRVVDFSLIGAGIGSAALATFVMAASFSMLPTLENEFNARLDMTAFGFAIAFSALMVGRLALQLPLGRLSDRIGRRPLILGGLILMAPSTLLLGEARTMLELTLLRFLQGAAAAGIAAPAFAVVADLSKEGGEGRQMSVVTTAFGFGLALGPLVSGILAPVFFELPFLVMAGLTVLSAWVVRRFLPETLRWPGQTGSGPPASEL